jgi:hypothetical protein
MHPTVPISPDRIVPVDGIAMCFPNTTPRHELATRWVVDPLDEDHPDATGETSADADHHGPRSGGASG